MSMKANDRSIINAFLRREETAIAMVTSQYGKYLHTIAFNILANDEDSAECVNDTYLKLWENIPPDNPKNFKAYISKIVRNLALNRYKEQVRQKRIPSEYTTSLDELAECIPGESSVEKEYNEIILKKSIENFIGTLSKRQKFMFVCRYYCGDSIDDIAKSLNISGSMVFHELSDIRKKLKNKLMKEDLWYEN